MSTAGSSVQVAVRARPLSDRENQLKTDLVMSMRGNEVTVKVPYTSGAFSHRFSYDHVFWSPGLPPAPDKVAATQSVLFTDIGLPVVDCCFEGFNVCVFAYGQTGSGKSYTMFGNPHAADDVGLIPRLTHKIFSEIEARKSPLLRFTVHSSYLEIYNEKVKCLLNPSLSNLKVREHPEQGPYVENLTRAKVENHQEVFRLMHEGNRLRTTASTSMNAHSSRSHAVFQLQVTQEIITEDGEHVMSSKTARLNLVDLAGSERVSKSHASGVRLQEGANINKSLTTLGLVISALAEMDGRGGGARKHVPYRDSVLTWILKDNLGGNSKTMMIATVSPAEDSYEETVSTLRYAERAKKIVNKAVINEDANSALIASLKAEIARLQAALEERTATAGAPEELEHHKALITQLQMTWEEKLKHAQEVALRRDQEVDAVQREKEELEGELEDLLAEKTKQDAELTELQLVLQERDSKLGEVLAELREKEQQHMSRLRSLEAEKSRLAQQGKDQTAAHRNEISKRDGQLHFLRQEMQQLQAQLQRQQQVEVRRQKLQSDLPHQVQALLHTLRIESVSEDEKELLQGVTVREMAQVYDAMGQGVEQEEVWRNLLLSLEGKQGRHDSEAASEYSASEVAEDLAIPLHAADDQDDELVASPRGLPALHGGGAAAGGGGVVKTGFEAAVAQDALSPPMAEDARRAQRVAEEEELPAEDAAERLLEEVLGPLPPNSPRRTRREGEERGRAARRGVASATAPADDDEDAVLDAFLAETLQGGEEDGEAEAEGSSDSGEKLLDDLLSGEGEQKQPGSPTAAEVAAMDQLLAAAGGEDGSEAEGSEDLLDQLLGDNLEAAGTQAGPGSPRRGTAALSFEAVEAEGAAAAAEAPAGAAADRTLRTRVWNLALFGASEDVAREGTSFVEGLVAAAPRDPKRHDDYCGQLASQLCGGVEPGASADQWARLRQFYAFYNRDRLPLVPEIEEKWSERGYTSTQVMDRACKKYQSAEPEALTEPPAQGVKSLKSHWFWGPVLAGRGPPPHVAVVDDDAEAAVDASGLPSPPSPTRFAFESEDEYWRARLQNFFRFYDPEQQLQSIEQLLQNFEGIEEEMMYALAGRYGPEPRFSGVLPPARRPERVLAATPPRLSDPESREDVSPPPISPPHAPSSASPKSAAQCTVVIRRQPGQELGMSLRQLLVTEVDRDSPADRAGVKPGLEVLTVAGKHLQSFAALAELIPKLGTQFEMTLAPKGALPVVDVSEVCFTNPATGDLLRFTISGGDALTYTVNGRDPRPPFREIKLVLPNRLYFTDIDRGCRIPIPKRAAILAGMRSLAQKTGIWHNIPSVLSETVQQRTVRKNAQGKLELLYDGETMIITAVTPGGPADLGGIKPGMRLLRVDGIAVPNATAYNACLLAAYDDQDIQIELGVPQEAKRSARDDYGSSANPVRMEINTVEGHGALLTGFKVQKLNPQHGKMKSTFAKDRVWVIDFFRRTFSNLNGGRATQSHPCSHLFRVEKMYQNPRQLRLNFYKAAHPNILEFVSSETRQRFYELSWALRRHICWLPGLVPSSNTTVSVNISGRSKRHKDVVGTATLHLTKEPAEVITVWSAFVRLGGDRDADRWRGSDFSLFLERLLPRPARHDLHFICMHDLPDHFSHQPLELVRCFKEYCAATGDLHPFLSTNLGGSSAVVIALARKRHISKVSNMEAIELRDQNTVVVGLSMRYAETSFCLVTAVLNPSMSTGKKNQKIATIMRKLDIGDMRMEFTSRFDHVVWLGSLGYDGQTHGHDDQFAAQMSSGNVLATFVEPAPTGDLPNFPRGAARCFTRSSRPQSLHGITYHTEPIPGMPEAEATIFSAAMLMYRPYIAALVPKRGRPTLFQFRGITLTVLHKEVARHLGRHLHLSIYSGFMEGSPIIVQMRWDERQSAYVSVNDDSLAPLHPVSWTEEYLRHQFVSFSVAQPIPQSASSAPPQANQPLDYPYHSWATGLLSLRHYAATGDHTPFQLSLHRTALRVGTVSGSLLHRTSGMLPAQVRAPPELASPSRSAARRPSLHTDPTPGGGSVRSTQYGDVKLAT
eukprot:TRINITY_DN4095_c0_g1_i2.p1 TRINITY_DN4095_c0_g1~~TRINITY_DN4095_c0_g1_i2.p1  ORF type:complete len:2082 (+),score=780.43 TRINITY_DN4095_c0_g1_i2:67-6246(+)